MSRSIALAAGGTGGHLFPALAVAEAIRELDPSARLLLISGSRQLDAELLADRGLEVCSTQVRPSRTKWDAPIVAGALLKATIVARKALKKHRVNAVLGFGGYPSLPGMLAAASLRLPRAVHEANALAQLGSANRIAARAGARVFGGFPVSDDPHARKNVGVPIRKEIIDLDWVPPVGETRKLLVLGGSLGAESLNAAAVELASQPPKGWEIKLSAGLRDFEHTSRNAKGLASIEVVPFIDDMAAAYLQASAVMARAGAATVAEIQHVGIPALLVPLPIARSREQHLNAQVLSSSRANVEVVEDLQLAAKKVSEWLTGLSPSTEEIGRGPHAEAASSLASTLLKMSEGHK